VADEAFTNAVQSYFEVVLKSERVVNVVIAGGFSSLDFREIFRQTLWFNLVKLFEKENFRRANIEKRIRNLPEIDGLSKETVLNSWMTKYDTIFRGEDEQPGAGRKATKSRGQAANQSQGGASDLILNKEQLYDIFQQILAVKKFEHQLIFNALQASVEFNHCVDVNRTMWRSKWLLILNTAYTADSKKFTAHFWTSFPII